MPDERKSPYLYIEGPDKEATIDFADEVPEDGKKVEGPTVKIEKAYDKHTGKATLHVYVTQGEYANILLDEVIDLAVEEQEEEEEEADDDDPDALPGLALNE